jgi:uncharacterized repeat protein (TIGR01451 family)
VRTGRVHRRETAPAVPFDVSRLGAAVILFLTASALHASASINKSFTPISITQGGTSTLTIFFFNDAFTPLSNAAVTDAIPAGVFIASPPNASTTCAGGTIAAAAGGSTAGISGATIPAQVGVTPGSCTMQVDVTSTVPGNHINTIPAGALTTAESITNATPASATLSVSTVAAPTGSKAFAPNLIAGGGTSTLTVTLNNSNGTALTGAGFTDNFPAAITVATPPGVITTCVGAIVSATAGAGSFSVAGATIPAGSNCNVKVNVTSSTNGVFTNTLPIGSITTTQGVSNAAAISGNLTVQTGAAVSKAFAPTTLPSGTAATLTVTITNGSPSPLTNAALTDNLPAGITVATPASPATTCVGGVVTGVSGATSFVLSGGTVPAASGATRGSCTFSVRVTSSTIGAVTNTIPIGALSDDQALTNPAVASATLTVISGATLAKAFAPNAIAAGATSTLTVTITNALASALTGAALTDNLPAGVTVAAAPAGASTCVGATVTAVPGATTISVSGATIPTSGNCNFSARVTSTTPGTVTNAILANSLTTTQGVTNTSGANSNLTITAGAALSKAFSPSTIASGGRSTLTITVSNNQAVPLTNAAFADNLPIGGQLVTVANPPTPGRPARAAR